MYNLLIHLDKMMDVSWVLHMVLFMDYLRDQHLEYHLYLLMVKHLYLMKESFLALQMLKYLALHLGLMMESYLLLMMSVG